jgi:hypothetical protein
MLRQLLLSVWVLVVFAPFVGIAASNEPNRQIVLSLPAETLLASVQKALPLDIPAQSRQVQGDIMLESLDELVIHNNVIKVRAVLVGRNLAMTTHFAGQDVQVRLGQVRLPMSCELQTRFDAARRQLFVTPQCTELVQNGNNSSDSLAQLLGSFAGREYPVDLNALETINIKIGTKAIPLALKPVKMLTANNSLTLYLMPQVGKSR